EAWLARSEPTGTTQAAVVRLLAKALAGKPAEETRPEIDRVLGLQRPDGGWAQLPDRSSDAYATGQALYVLSLAGVKPDRPEIKKGVAFLVATQREDGS